MFNRILPIIVLLSLAATPVFAQRGAAETTINGKEIRIDYGRPSLQGRDMIGQLPVGQAWRMGMNEATTLDTEATLSFGDVLLEPGQYTLTVRRVSEDQWHLILSNGSASREVPLKSQRSDAPVETFTIELQSRGDRGQFSMAWGTLEAATDFTAH